MTEDGGTGGPEIEHSDEEAPGAGAGDPGREGGEGARNAETTPKLDEGGEAGQTQAPAEPGDVGVPSDEQIAEEEEEVDRDES